MVRNATKYYFPIKESIASALPLVDEFIVALGKGDVDDATREQLLSLNSPKIRIIDRVWNEADFADGKVFADETTFALSECTGDWCLYLQADEVLHEQDITAIKKACLLHNDNTNVDGLLFDYFHFWGDYEHYLPYHGWYKKEIRIVRNFADIVSYKDAQSFRKKNGVKLNVACVAAHVYHYGWVRPPSTMKRKKTEQDNIHHPSRKLAVADSDALANFNYGAMGKVPIYKGTHPATMAIKIASIDWQLQLNYTKYALLNRPKMKHERLKYRLLTRLENLLGVQLGGYSNWRICKYCKK